MVSTMFPVTAQFSPILSLSYNGDVALNYVHIMIVLEAAVKWHSTGHLLYNAIFLSWFSAAVTSRKYIVAGLCPEDVCVCV